MREDKIRAEKRRLKQKELMERKRMKSQIQPVMRSMIKYVVDGEKRNSYCLLRSVLCGVFKAGETFTLKHKGHVAKSILRADGLLEYQNTHLFKSVSEWMEHLRLTTKIPIPKVLAPCTKETLPVGWIVETYARSGNSAT